MFAWNWHWPELRHRLNKSINGDYLFLKVLKWLMILFVYLICTWLKVLRWRSWTQVKDWFTVQAATFPWNVSTGSFAFPNIIFTSHFLLHWNVCKVKISYLFMKCFYTLQVSSLFLGLFIVVAPKCRENANQLPFYTLWKVSSHFPHCLSNIVLVHKFLHFVCIKCVHVYI